MANQAVAPFVMELLFHMCFILGLKDEARFVLNELVEASQE